MAASKQPPPKAKSSGRTTVLAALVAVIVVVAVWLSNCIPGFGMGSSDRGDGEGEADGQPEAAKPESDKADSAKSEPDKPEPAKPDPAQPDLAPPQLGAAGKTLNVKIDVAGCAVAGSEPVECSKVCERAELFEGMDDAVLEVSGASHGSVVEMVDCLKAMGIDKVAIRRESP
jgi:hypothetical protein